jgi:hypothetical protein
MPRSNRLQIVQSLFSGDFGILVLTNSVRVRAKRLDFARRHVAAGRELFPSLAAHPVF